MKLFLAIDMVEEARILLNKMNNDESYLPDIARVFQSAFDVIKSDIIVLYQKVEAICKIISESATHESISDPRHSAYVQSHRFDVTVRIEYNGFILNDEDTDATCDIYLTGLKEHYIHSGVLKLIHEFVSKCQYKRIEYNREVEGWGHEYTFSGEWYENPKDLIKANLNQDGPPISVMNMIEVMVKENQIVGSRSGDSDIPFTLYPVDLIKYGNNEVASIRRMVFDLWYAYISEHPEKLSKATKSIMQLHYNRQVAGSRCGYEVSKLMYEIAEELKTKQPADNLPHE